MEVKYDIKVTIDNEIIYERELTLINTCKRLIKAALLAAMTECKEMSIKEVEEAIANYEPAIP